MASTYTVNLGIEKIGTGEQSGTWGNTTNTNFDLIDQAVNGAVTISLASAGTSGSPNSLVITNGASSDGRNKFIEFNDGGDLGATAYVQLDPNDAEKIVHMRNSLSGGRSVIVFQGTYNASNDFEIPNGKDVVLKFDGAGASATVTDVFTDLQATAITTPDLTATTVDINGGTIDGATLGGSSQVTITDADMNGGTIDGVVIGGASAAAGTFTTLQADTSLNVDGTVTADGLTVDDGTVLIRSDNAGNLSTPTIRFLDTDTSQAAGQKAGQVEFYTSDSSPGPAGVYAYVNAQAENTNGLGALYFGTGLSGSAANRLSIGSGGDISFFEDTGTTPKFFWDASAESLTVGSTQLNFSTVKVQTGDGSASAAGFNVFTSSTGDGYLLFSDGNVGNQAYTGQIRYNHASDFMAFGTNGGAERMRIDSSGNVGIGTSSPQMPLTVNGTLQAINSTGVSIANGATATVLTPPRGYSYVNVSTGAGTNYGLLLLVFRSTTTLTIVSTVDDKTSADYSASVSGTALQVTNSYGSTLLFYASCVNIGFGIIL